VFVERSEHQVSSRAEREERVSCAEREPSSRRKRDPSVGEKKFTSEARIHSAAERSFRKGRTTDLSGQNLHRAEQKGRREDVHVVGREKRDLATARDSARPCWRIVQERADPGDVFPVTRELSPIRKGETVSAEAVIGWLTVGES
jgi:hypothetical protein